MAISIYLSIYCKNSFFFSNRAQIREKGEKLRNIQNTQVDEIFLP